MQDKLLHLHSLLKDAPNEPFIFFALAQEYEKQQQFDEARKYYHKLSTDFPNYAGSYYHFGKFLEKFGEKDQAMKIYKKGMEITLASGDLHALSELRAAAEELNE